MSLTHSPQAASSVQGLSVYAGYADGLRPAGSIFPNPWRGSDNVDFYGDAGTYDSAALRFDNNTDHDITLTALSVQALQNWSPAWPLPVTLKKGRITIFAQVNGSGLDFDISDDNGTSWHRKHGS